MSVASGCRRHIDWTNTSCGDPGVLCDRCANLDPRWSQALTGLPCIALVVRDDERQRKSAVGLDGRRHEHKVALPYLAEITGVYGSDVWVVLSDESEPRRVSWWDIRPCAPEATDA